MNRHHPFRSISRLVVLAILIAGLAPASASAADVDVVTLEIVVDGVYLATAKSRLHEPVTFQPDARGPILGIYPEQVGLRGDSVSLAVYEVDDVREVGSRRLLESLELTAGAAAALDLRAAASTPPVEVRLVRVELADR